MLGILWEQQHNRKAKLTESKQPGFQTTCWSDVRRAASLDHDARSALERLCRQYWYPLYAYLRRSGHDPSTAQDHVQSFFADLLSRESLKAADPDRGRFRTFMLTACRNHVANRHRAESTQRRGGHLQQVSIESAAGEQRYDNEPVDQWTPEALFDRRWALAVIDAAMERLRQEYEAKGRSDRFAALQPLIAPSGIPPTHAEIARRLDCTPNSVKVAAHRLRMQFGEALREEVAMTVDATSETDDKTVDQELQFLLAALQGPA